MLHKGFSLSLSLHVSGDGDPSIKAKVAIWIYWASILFCLLNYGANKPLVIAFESIIVSALLLVQIAMKGIPSATRGALVASLMILFLLLGWILFQVTPLPNALYAHPSWTEIQAMAPDVDGVISVTPRDDLTSFLKIAMPFGIFLIGIFLFPTDKAAAGAMRVYAIAGGLIAALSILQFTLSPESLLFGSKQFYRDSLTSYFINRNTAATFFGLTSLLLVTLTWQTMAALNIRRVFSALDHRMPMTAESKKQLYKSIAFSSLLTLSLLALVLTKSRAGIGASMVGLLWIVFFLAVRHRPRDASVGFGRRGHFSWQRILLACGCVLVVIAFFGIGAQRMLLRAEVKGADDSRFCITSGIVSAIKDHFPIGSGLASFQEIFPGYRDSSCGIQGVWDKAHSVYLEGLLSLGVMFPITFAIGLLYLVFAFVRGIRHRRQYRFAGDLGLACLILVTLHSALDFSLQIPGFAMVIAAVLAPLVTLCLRPSRRNQRTSRSS